MSTENQLGYDPSKLSPSVVHIGYGGFARGFLAHFLHEIAQTGNTQWGMVGIKPNTPHTSDLNSPDNLSYILATGNGPNDRREIGVVREVIGGKGNNDAVISKLASPETKVVSLTITSAGYCLDNAGNPDMFELGPDVVAIREKNYGKIHTAPGMIVASLFERQQNNQEPPVILSLDNLPANGTKVSNVIKAMAGQIGREFADYVATITTPNTVVDRIVPPCPKDRPLHALEDEKRQSIVAENYRDLAVETTFRPGELPPLDKVGASYVPDIRQAEELKLRLVNGGHLALAVVGKAMGIELVTDAVSPEKNPSLRLYLERFLNQAADAIRPPPSVDLPARVESILHRYEDNRTDNVDRLLKSTYEKVIPRLFNDHAVRDDKPSDASAFAIGAWLQYMQKKADSGKTYSLLGDDEGQKPIKSVRELENHLRPGAQHIDNSNLRAFAAKAYSFYLDMQDHGVGAVLQKVFPSPTSAPADPTKLSRKGTALDLVAA